MTTITIDRAVFEQALDALMKSHTCPLLPDDCEEAITALRAALAQQAEPGADPFNCPKCGRHDYGLHGACPTCDAQQAEPNVEYERGFIDGMQKQAQSSVDKAVNRMAEPVEPVAWMYTGIKQDGTEHGPHLVWKPEYMDAMSASKGAKATPLYTAPPQRKPLTEEGAAKACGASGNLGPLMQIVRAAERAHGIGEGA